MAEENLNYRRLLFSQNNEILFPNCNNIILNLDWSKSNYNSLSNLFLLYTNLINCSILNAPNLKYINNLYNCFTECSNLINLDVSNWNTSNVTNLARCFYACNNVTTLDVSNWDVSNVYDMSWVFSLCLRLKNIGNVVANWNTANVGRMDGLFSEGRGSTDPYGKDIINLSDWNTTKLKVCYNTFAYCFNLKTVWINNWDMSNVYMAWAMFAHCHNLKNINTSNWNLCNCKNMAEMFEACYNLEMLDVSNWNVSNVNSLYKTFCECWSLTNLDVSNWNTINVDSLNGTFKNCRNLTTLDVSNWNVSNVNNIADIFYGCNGLSVLDISNWDTSNVKNLSASFFYLKNLTSLDVSNWNVNNVKDLSSTFSTCSNLSTLNVSKWNTSNVQKLEQTFKSCFNLTTLNLSNWNISKVNTLYATFFDCGKLSALDVSNWDISNVNNLTWTFYHCDNLTTLDVSNWNTSKVTSLANTFQSCNNLVTLDVSNWNISNVNNLSNTFYNCASLVTLDISNWDTSNVKNLNSIFHNTGKRWNAKQNVYGLDFNWIQNWNFSNVTNMSGFLNNAKCGYFPLYNINNIQPYINTGLPNIYWNTDKVTDISWAFAFESARPNKSAEDQPNLYVDWDTDNNAIHTNWFFNFSKVKNAVGTFSANSIYFWYLYEDSPSDFWSPLTGGDYWLYLNNTENMINVKNMFASGYSRSEIPFIYDAYSDAPTFNVQNTILNFNNVVDASYLFYNYQPINYFAFYNEGESYISPRKILPTLILNNIVNLAYAYYSTRTPIIDTTYWNLSKVTNIKCMFSRSYALDNNSLKNIANALLTATNIPAHQKNLFINNVYGPFNQTTDIHEGSAIPKMINNATVGTSLVSQLRAAGWSVPE